MSTFKINKIFNLDFFECFKIVHNNSIDLELIDPPYNLSKAERDTFKTEEYFLDFTYKWIRINYSDCKINTAHIRLKKNKELLSKF